MSPQCREIFNNSFVSVGGGVPLGILVLLPVDVVDHGQGVVVTILLPEDITQGLSLPGKNDMIGGDHTRAPPPTMARAVAV
ncbi:hypothetical protein F2Q69_00047098 [Brassica cretica]|uniref:Uncharacterized protein n=1 Tax=Brassica cretica TaxID=69181 RepID=A0A8S9PPR4_BRACR|nr:hypothetical protein F2Q69_00047098 [Brassica cretica]